MIRNFKVMDRKLSICTIAAAILISGNVSYASEAAKFLEKMEGSFRGSGQAIPQSGTGPVRISCRLSNTYSKGTGKLSIAGNCASTQGKTSVTGSLVHKGTSVSGSFISPFANMKLTRSSGRVNGNTLTVNSTFVQTKTGELNEVRQVVRSKGSGFVTEFFSYDRGTKKFKSAGSVSFSRK